MFISRSIRDYVDAASSNEPTPGGGSVSALAAALGTSMGVMAANFTTDPNKYGDRLDRINGVLAKLVTFRENFLTLAPHHRHLTTIRKSTVAGNCGTLRWG